MADLSDNELLDDETEVSRVFSLFYPMSPSTAPDPTSTAARFAQELQAYPSIAGLAATELSELSIQSAATRPAHIDRIIQATQIILSDPSLPLINNWHSSRPNATFSEIFRVAFRDDLNDAHRGPIIVSERDSYLAASLLGGRVRSMGLLTTPEIIGSIAEGLKFPDEILYNYQGEAADIAAIAACLHLLGGINALVQAHPSRFSKEKIIAALDDLQNDETRSLIEVSTTLDSSSVS
jgi:hypothetical protein